MKVLVCNGAPELCLFATKPIAAGTEILYDYGVKVPWESEVIVSLCFSLVIRVFEIILQQYIWFHWKFLDMKWQDVELADQVKVFRASFW